MFQVFYTSLDHVRIAALVLPACGRAGRITGDHAPAGLPDGPADSQGLGAEGLRARSPSRRAASSAAISQFNPGYPNLLTHNIVDRHTYAYRGFYVDTWRGIDVLLSRPEVDPARIGVTGSSQGGGLTITTAAMRQRSARRRPARPTCAASWMRSR